MKRLFALVLFGLSGTGETIRTFDGLTFCTTEVVDLNGGRKSEIEKYLQSEYPFASMVPTSTALECLLVSPEGPYAEHVKMVLEFSNSPASNGYTSLLSTVKLVGQSTGLSYYVRSGHLIASDRPEVILEGFKRLGSALLKPLESRINY